MNCNSCRFELSQCLDGRLPSGRRAIVMQHVAECGGCADYWAELQAAQELVLRLPRQTVGRDFRDRLWARIQAGEGTPEAVFKEPIPALTKVRYALTGAAAAAAVLLAASWLRNDNRPAREDIAATESGIATDRNVGEPPRANEQRPVNYSDVYQPGGVALVSSAQPLTGNLVAVEAAKQFERRLALANRALRRLHDRPEDVIALRQTFQNADELRGFGTLLLRLRDIDRLSFRDSGVDADLRVAMNLLDEKRLTKRNLDTAHSVVAPAVSLENLGNLVGTMQVQPTIDPRGETEVVFRLTTMEPDLFAQMFFVLGNPDELSGSYGLPRRPGMFWVNGQCGLQLVAPRSDVDKFEIHITHKR